MFFKHWYYDNAQPEDMSGANGTPHYPNNWDLCARRDTGQVINYFVFKNIKNIFLVYID